MFASNAAQHAGGSSTSKAALPSEDDDLDLDPEYAPKRALTTKVDLSHQSSSLSSHSTRNICSRDLASCGAVLCLNSPALKTHEQCCIV